MRPFKALRGGVAVSAGITGQAGATCEQLLLPYRRGRLRTRLSVTAGLTLAALALALALLGSVWAAQSSAYVYWTSYEETGTIGRGNLEGKEVNPSFITGAIYPWGVAVDGGHVYWANWQTGTIGRANLNGTEVNQSFITGASLPTSVAVDGGHVYWTNPQFETNTIGRANLEGKEVNQSFITGASEPDGVAVDGGHVYWANKVGDTIGRANLNGTEVNQSFITGAGEPFGVAVDGGHVYWAKFAAYAIGRANLEGTEVIQSFIPSVRAPDGVAVDGGHVYWATLQGTIGRANLEGKEVNQSFITGLGPWVSVAVDGGRVSPPTVATKAASSVAQTSATLNATVNPNGGEVSQCKFEYGTTASYGSSASCSSLPGSGSSPLAVSASLTGLAANTIYHFRIVAANPAGTSYGVDQTFTTLFIAALPGQGGVLGSQEGKTPPAPTVADAAQSRSIWSEGNKLATFSRKKKPPVGTTFSFILNEQARVSFAFTQPVGGRKVKGSCVAQTKKNRHNPFCKRTVTRATLSFTGHGATNKVVFQGRVSRSKKLTPGRYTLIITATNSAGARSAPKSLSFTIAR